MKSKIEIKLAYNPNAISGTPYAVERISGAVKVTHEPPGKKATVVRAGDHITEQLADDLASVHDVTVTPVKP